MTSLQVGMGWFTEEPGGLNRFYAELLRHLPACGVTAKGLVAGSNRVVGWSGGRVRAFAAPSASIVARWLALRRTAPALLDSSHATLVAGHFALYVFPLLDLLRGRPLVVHFHGPWSAEAKIERGGRSSTLLRKTIERVVYRSAKRLIVLSEAFARVLVHDYGVPRERIEIVPGGVDLERFSTTLERREARARLGWPATEKLALAVRRLTPRMGLETLVDAFAEVRGKLPGARLAIAGSGPLGATLAARIDELGLGDTVRLVGPLSDDALALAYRAADVTIVPSVCLEGFGLVVAESLAAGTPALVTPVGGLPEVVRGLSAELVLSGGGREAIARGLTAALSSELRLPSDEACRSHAARFAWQTVAARIGDVYARVAA